MTHSTSAADSTLGIRIPNACSATAARSASHQAVRAALTRTQAECSVRTSATMARAVALASGGTASSRSSITASAPASKTLPSSLALCPGANR